MKKLQKILSVIFVMIIFVSVSPTAVATQS